MININRQGLLVSVVLTLIVLLSPMFESSSAMTYFSSNTDKLKLHYYNIYNLRYLVYDEGQHDISRVFYIENDYSLTIGGDGFISLINLTDLSEYFRWSILGSVVSLGYDALVSPRWVVVGSSMGEIVGLRLSDGYVVDYNSPSGAAVKDVYVASSGGSWVLAVDEDRYLYVYKLGFDGLAVIGPRVGGGVSELGGISVLWAAALRFQEGDVYYDPERFLVVVDSSGISGEAQGILRGDLYVEAYYVDELFKELHPAAAGSVNLSGSEVEVRELSFAVEVVPYNLVYVNGSIGSGNLIALRDLPRTTYRIHALYFVKVIDRELNVTISRKCYYGYRDVGVDSPITLTNVTLTYQDDVSLCISGLRPRPPDIGVSELLLLNATKAPGSLDFSVRLYPWPRDSGGFSREPVYSLVGLSGGARGMPSIVDSILAVSSADREVLLVYLLDRDLNPVRFSNSSSVVGGVVEPIVVNGGVSVVDVSFDGEYIVVGSLDGRVIILSWDQADKRYVYKWSLRLSSQPINHVAVIDETHAIAVARDGIAQLIDLVDGSVLWISDGSSTGLRLTDKRIVNVGYAGSQAIYAVDSGGRIIEFNHGLRRYTPLTLNISILVEDEGNAIVEYSGDSIVEVFDSSDKKAESRLVEGISTIYAPVGSTIDLAVSIDGIGRIVYPDITVKPGLNRVSDTVYLRRVEIKVYTPSEAEDPLLSMAYSLVSGPVGSASVRLESSIYGGNMDRLVIPYTINSTTDDHGVASVLAFNEVSYNVYVEKPGYHESSAMLEPGMSSIAVKLYPLLHDVTITAVDSDALLRGVTYYASNTSYTITLLDTGKSISVEGNPVTLLLPAGTYSISASSPYYEANSTIYIIGNDTSVTILVKPETYSVELRPEVVDDRLNLATGPLTRALINVTLLEPYRVNMGIYSYGSTITLRYGIYSVEVLDDLVKLRDSSVIIVVDESGAYRLELAPAYIRLDLKVYDGEMPSYEVEDFSIEVEYRYATWINSATLNPPVNGSPVELPAGVYRISIESIGYNSESLDVGLYKDEAINIYLEPIYRSYIIQVVFEDKLVGLASGGVPHAGIRLDMIRPGINKSYKITTDSGGLASVFARGGLYRISITSSYTEHLESTLILDASSSRIIIHVKPKYYTLTTTAIDSETLEKLESYLLEVGRLKPGLPSTITINASPGYTLLLPAGQYILKAYIEGLYRPKPTIIDLTGSQSVSLIAVPVKVGVEILIVGEETRITYNGASYTLPSTPIPGATVRLKGIDTYTTKHVVESVTGDDGRVGFTGLRPGLYRITVEKAGYTSYTDIIDVRVNNTRVIWIEPITNDVVFKPVDSLRRDSNIISNVELIISGYNGVKVDIRIKYFYPDRIYMPSGLYKITVSGENYYSSHKSLYISYTGRVNTVEITLNPIEYNVDLKIRYRLGASTGPVKYGFVIAEPLEPSLNLREEGYVYEGKGKLKLPAGVYALYYSPSSEWKKDAMFKIGEVSVDGNMELTLELPVYNVSITLLLIDREVKLPVGEATIQVLYHGPFGSFNETVTTKRDSITLQVPPGHVGLRIKSLYHKLLEVNRTIMNNTLINAYLDPLTVDLTVRIASEDGYNILEPMLIRLTHSLYPVTYDAKINNSIAFLGGVRLGDYIVEVRPVNRDSVYNVTRVRVSVEASELEIIVNYKKYNVTIQIADSETDELITTSHMVVFQNEMLSGISKRTTITGKATIKIPPGNYTVKLVPMEVELYDKYEYKEYFFSVSKPTLLKIELPYKRYRTSIFAVYGGKPIGDAEVTIYREDHIISKGNTDHKGIYRVMLEPGEYKVKVSKRGYKTSIVNMEIPDIRPTVVSLEPEPITLLLNWAPLIAVIAALAILMTIIIYKYK